MQVRPWRRCIDRRSPTLFGWIRPRQHEVTCLGLPTPRLGIGAVSIGIVDHEIRSPNRIAL